MKKRFYNQTVAIMCLASFMFMQCVWNTGAVICVKADGQANMEWGCECRDDHTSHAKHKTGQDQHQLEEMTCCIHDPCSDISISASVLVQTTNSRGQYRPDMSIDTYAYLNGLASISQDQNRLIFSPLIFQQQTPEFISSTILIV